MLVTFWRVACGSLWLAWLAVPSAHAQRGGNPQAETAPNPYREATPDPPREAFEHYLRGRRAYLAGRYREALVELKAARALDRDAPDLTYNIARVHENLGEFDEAITYYDEYMQSLPRSDTDERERTAKTIRRLHGAKRERALNLAREKRSLAPTSIGRADFVFWLTASTAVACFGGGAVTGMLAVKSQERVANYVAGVDGTLERRERFRDEAKRFALIADGLFIAGGLALTSAALLYLLRDRERPDVAHTRLTLGVDPVQRSVQLSGSFF